MLLPTLSIVIPSHQRPDLLADCLARVCRHAPAGTDILVIDDASPNESVRRVAESFAAVRCLRLHRRLGFAGAVNRGLAAAHGAIVEVLNDDVQVTAGWAESALRCFDDPAVAAVAPLVLLGTEADGRWIIDSAGDEYHLGGYARKRGHGQRFGPAYAQACDVFGASASSAFYRRAALHAVGLFPEEFGAYFEDVDLSWRLRRAGWRIVYEPQARVWHRGGASHRPSRRLAEQQSRNEELVYWRNVPNARAALPLHAAVLAGKAIRRWREGTLGPWLFGRLRAWAAVARGTRHRLR